MGNPKICCKCQKFNMETVSLEASLTNVVVKRRNLECWVLKSEEE